MSVSCLSVGVCAIAKTHASPWTGNLLSKIAISFCVPVVSMIRCTLNFIQVLGSFQTSVLCLMRNLAGGGSVAAAVGVNDR